MCDWHVSDQTVTRTEKVVEWRDIIFAFLLSPIDGSAIRPPTLFPVMHLLNSESSDAFVSPVRRSAGEQERGQGVREERMDRAVGIACAKALGTKAQGGLGTSLHAGLTEGTTLLKERKCSDQRLETIIEVLRYQDKRVCIRFSLVK